MGQHAHFLCARDHVQPPLATGQSPKAIGQSQIAILATVWGTTDYTIYNKKYFSDDHFSYIQSVS